MIKIGKNERSIENIIRKDSGVGIVTDPACSF